MTLNEIRQRLSKKKMYLRFEKGRTKKYQVNKGSTFKDITGKQYAQYTPVSGWLSYRQLQSWVKDNLR